MFFKKNIIGNGKICDMLERSYKKDKLSHAYLFEGPEHIGKKTLAIDFARLILGGEDKIKKGIDFELISAVDGRKQITIEQIRSLERNLSFSPHSSDYKVAVIEQAEKMNEEASNALLKTLEEPPKSAILILLTSNSGIMLDTIKSRCQILKFLPVKKTKLEDLLKSKTDNEENIEKIIEIAGFKPGKVIELAEDKDSMKNSFEELDYFSRLPEKNFIEKIEKAQIISDQEINKITEILDLWIICLRNILIKKYEKNTVSEKGHIMKILERMKSIRKTKESILEKNINIKLAIENLILDM